jgi:uncharacterized RDD family membrane protein YckC
MAKLLIQESNGTREFELVDLEVNIGRELDNTLRLADPSISRHHAVLRRTDAGYEVRDLGSSNGVLLNGVKVDAGNLKDGDRITLGQMQITFLEPAAPEPANPLGTVRMSPEEMAKIQGGSPEAAPAPDPVPPPMAPAAAFPPPPPPPPPPARPEAFAAPADAGPVPSFLQPYLPEVPDGARPLLAGGAIERGDFLTRLVATLIDGVVGLVFYVIFWLAVVVLGILTHGIGAIIGCALYPLLGIAYTLFLLWCVVACRATIGKKIMKLRVVPEANPLGNITWGQAILRLVGYWVNSIVLFLPYLLILTSERKGLQDMFSGTVVIKVDR